MKYYIIQNKKTKQIVAGTDYRYNPPQQIYANSYVPPLLFTQERLETESLARGINPKLFTTIEIELFKSK